jgi:hypothetical protein
MSDLIDTYFALSLNQRAGYVISGLFLFAILAYILNFIYRSLKVLLIKIKQTISLVIINKGLSLIIGICLLPIVFVISIIRVISSHFDFKRKQRIIEDTILAEKVRAEFRDKSARKEKVIINHGQK